MSDYSINDHIEFIDKKIRALKAIIDDLEQSKTALIESIAKPRYEKKTTQENLGQVLKDYIEFSKHQPKPKEKRLATVKQIPDLYNGFTESSIRWLIFNEKYNGFSICVRRLGKKVLIDLDAFEKWIDSPEYKSNFVIKNI